MDKVARNDKPKVAIYDKKGNEYLKKSIDARECVKTGFYFYENPVSAANDETVKGQKKSSSKKEVTNDENQV